MRSEESVQTFALANSSGPSVFTHRAPFSDAPGTKYIEAWISNFGSSNVHIFEGTLNVAQALAELENDRVDMLMTITGTGVSGRRVPDSVNEYTVLFEAQNTSGQFQAVTVKFGKNR